MATALLPPPATESLDSDDLYEIVDGKLVEYSSTTYASITTNRLAQQIMHFVEGRNLGEALVLALFHLPLEVERQRRPDVAFISTARWPQDRPMSIVDNAWKIAPDIAIEVVSPTDRAEELAEKIGEYFAAGVIQVWVVYPLLKSIQVHESAALARSYYETEILTVARSSPDFN